MGLRFPANVPIPGSRKMGGLRLVFEQTPWTKWPRLGRRILTLQEEER